MALPDGKKNFDDMYNRHNTIIATDRRTDGRTDGEKSPISIAHQLLMRYKNRSRRIANAYFAIILHMLEGCPGAPRPHTATRHTWRQRGVCSDVTRR